MVQTIFKRTEKKYLLTKEQYNSFLNLSKDYLKSDEFGLHTVCNIYYDTTDFLLIRNSIEKPVYKEKLRLRSYDVPNDSSKVYIELKKNYDGIVYKRRITLKEKEAEKYLENKQIDRDDQISSEINYVLKHYNLVPKLYLAYNRIAYYDLNDSNLRITFDSKIRSRTDNLDLKLGDAGELLFDDDLYLMEIKMVGGYPLWLVKILDNLDIYPTSFSKYGNVYKKMLKRKEVVYV